METKAINPAAGNKKEDKTGKGKNIAKEGAKVAGAAAVGAGAAFAASAAFSPAEEKPEEIVEPTTEENVEGGAHDADRPQEETQPKAEAHAEEVKPEEIVITHEQVEEILGPQDIAVVEVEPIEGEPSFTIDENLIVDIDDIEIDDPSVLVTIDGPGSENYPDEIDPASLTELSGELEVIGPDYDPNFDYIDGMPAVTPNDLVGLEEDLYDPSNGYDATDMSGIDIDLDSPSTIEML